ncbi:hypothetical protein [Oceanobacillus oncorhynchi]|uniref:hypothetical protein n=1 Tax=Oceanobacillus oncorhynchi TaxID=545501 RepID=UPI0034D3D957
MFENTIRLENGKYTLVNNLSTGGGFYAQRYGEEWRDLAGDGLVLALFHEIEKLKEDISILLHDKGHYEAAIHDMDSLADSVRYNIGELPTSEKVADKIVKLISDLEKEVGEIV